MENSSLFSHPELPQKPKSSGETPTEPVEHPTFSDRPPTNASTRGDVSARS